MGDAMTQQPMICNLGEESWRQKEARAAEGVPDAWGALATRGEAWEVATALTVLEAGADIVVLRHPGLAGRRARGARRPDRRPASRRRRVRRRRHEGSADAMALTGLQIYKLLPQTNCKECGYPTCLAFAMKLAQKGAELDACPYVSDEARAALDAASAPPIRLVGVGAGERRFEVGNEVAMFRHEKTFYHQPGLVVRLRSDDGELAAAGRARGRLRGRARRPASCASTASRSTTPAPGRRRTRRR